MSYSVHIGFTEKPKNLRKVLEEAGYESNIQWPILMNSRNINPVQVTVYENGKEDPKVSVDYYDGFVGVSSALYKASGDLCSLDNFFELNGPHMSSHSIDEKLLSLNSNFKAYVTITSEPSEGISATWRSSS